MLVSEKYFFINTIKETIMTVICEFCSKVSKDNNHRVRCRLNPNRKMRVWTEDQIEKAKIQGRDSNIKYWSNEHNRKKQSERMRQVVKNNPDSYSKNNVSGRVKIYEVNSSTGPTKVKGKWELSVANWLNENKIEWTNNIKPYNYFWDNNWHLYFPDFLIIKKNILIEVKGYETERDREKWKSVNIPLIIIKKNEINDLETILCGLR
jgi:hypothetical protein